ncbi:MAG: 6,7-dimethyl-8-ribityllumazine synthase [bacterium]|jgi:6,7-dimethyl-8-ribityllumazine synthase|nr:6,7-dimethyl-8-ribityllumazine synthase [bacterium]
MPKVYEGALSAAGKRFGIVVGRFNAFISKELLGGALDCITRHAGESDKVDVVWVPGSFEIPLLAQKMAGSGRYDALICLGAVIRGSTSHYDYVCSEAAKGIAAASRETGIPVMFGILTTDTIEQAIERAGTKAGNKGWDAAMGAIEMVGVLESWEKGA